jgi:hypothetical protein
MNDASVYLNATIPGPARSTVARSRQQAEQAVEMGRAFAGAIKALGRALTSIYRISHDAYEMRELAALGDKGLAARGLVRSDLPTLATYGMGGDTIESAVRQYHSEFTRPSHTQHHNAA